MPCFHPWKHTRREGGKLRTDLPTTTLACGRCIGCRMSKSQDWATRIVHESQLHEASCFVTLTYADEHLPEDYSVNVRHLQLFMKRLRKWMGHNRCRYFACAEYGDKNLRPHYHLILFGVHFPDRVLRQRHASGFYGYHSPKLDELWGMGRTDIGDVTLQSAGYVARYVFKKVTGDPAEMHYTRIHPVTGLVWKVQPEFAVMSTRPGLGSGWYEKFSREVFPSDFVVINGKKRPIPKYYNRLLARTEEVWEPGQLSAVVAGKRKEHADDQAANNTPARLATREESLELKAKQLQRELDQTE